MERCSPGTNFSGQWCEAEQGGDGSEARAHAWTGRVPAHHLPAILYSIPSPNLVSSCTVSPHLTLCSVPTSTCCRAQCSLTSPGAVFPCLTF